ncbi:MAG: IS3 family transposase [Faecalibacillus intestinalis]|uniref:IS3 family transposase n=1 Tax=Faecalibacillus intestinalis TaxID=1982626 RepID=UPI00384AAA0F
MLSVVKPIYEENKSRYGYRRVILSIDSKILSKLNVGRDRIRKVLRDNGLLGI